MNNTPWRWLLSASLLILSFNTQAESLVSLDTRPGVSLSFLLLEPSQPKAVVLLFAGGRGRLGLSQSSRSVSLKWGRNNFLVRSRALFVQQGLVVALIDAPSDRLSKPGLLGGFRTSNTHAKDIRQVIEWLRLRYELPVWLVGTSRGTESVAHLGIQIQDLITGLVLTSSMTVRDKKGKAVTDLPIGEIKRPVLLIAHKQDACAKTPPQGVFQISRMLTAAKPEVRLFEGGSIPRSKPCKALSYHGFLGIELQVVVEIAGFIKAEGG